MGAEAAAAAVQKRAGDSSVQPAARQLLPKARQDDAAATQQLDQLTTSVKPAQVRTDARGRYPSSSFKCCPTCLIHAWAVCLTRGLLVVAAPWQQACICSSCLSCWCGMLV